MTSTVKVDRRVRRTRELLHGAVVSLILEKGYEAVTVQDILDRADIGRSTFYAHYRDKDELLLSGFDESFAVFAADTLSEETSQRKVEFLEPARALFLHAEGHLALWKALVGKRGAELVRRHLHERLTDLIDTHLRVQLAEPIDDELRLAAAVNFIVSSLVGTLIWWAENDVLYTADEIFTTYKQLTTQGVKRYITK